MVLRVSAPDAAHAPGAELGNLPAGLQDISVSLDLAVGLCHPLEACLHYAFYTGSLRKLQPFTRGRKERTFLTSEDCLQLRCGLIAIIV